MTKPFENPISPICLILIPICHAFSSISKRRVASLLTIYADDEDVEVSILVDPSHRRQGIARAMYRSFEKEMASYPIRSVTFQTGVFFLDHHPDLAVIGIWLKMKRRKYWERQNTICSGFCSDVQGYLS